MTQFSNPLLGILAGMIFTAVIQSSSASVGILQALVASGLIGHRPVRFTSSSAKISAPASPRCWPPSAPAERQTHHGASPALQCNRHNAFHPGLHVHLSPRWSHPFTPGNLPAQIANMHTVFNVVTTLLLLPFGNYLAKLAVRILPEHASEGKRRPQASLPEARGKLP